ncbi:MAG: NAD(P)/FAD-dependent oxidoreductase [Dehalococcoidia bacterium]|nr:NAD(P)/FAD-dependent oxidoreductase [Dehalococcoidia bacterium]
MSYQTDITIVGAGVIGLAIASQIANESKEVYILEKNRTFGQEASSRNSEVIHAGIYYPKDSLKAKMCIEGNRLLYGLCQKHNVDYKRIGKIIVANTNAENKELEKLYNSGKNNGIDLRMLSRKEMNHLEPNIRGISALLSPSTGIVESQALMKYFLNKARSNGAQIVYKTKISGIDKVPGGYKIKVEDTQSSFSFITRVLINCAGLRSDKIASMAGVNINEAGYRLRFCKGEYYSILNRKSKFLNRLVYTIPTATGLGVHVCCDVSGRMRVGPLYYFVDEINYKIDGSKKIAFCESSLMRALPFLEAHDLEPEMAGVKAIPQKGEGFKDFIISHECNRDLPGFINLIGIDSPGLTSAPAIAIYVSNLVNEILKNY